MKKRLRYSIVLAVLLAVGCGIGWLAKGWMSPSASTDMVDSIRIPVITGSPLLDSLRQQMEKWTTI